MCDTAKADRYYGRADVPSEDDKKATAEILEGKKFPDLDKTLPWMLLVRGMYSMLYEKEEVRLSKILGHRGDQLPQPIRLTTKDWARAFNIITFTYVLEFGLFKKPTPVKEVKMANGRKIALAILVQDPGKGLAKSESYVRGDERLRTLKILGRMEKHRLELAELDAVKKHLASLRDPEVQS
jgi:hypothetical protein